MRLAGVIALCFLFSLTVAQGISFSPCPLFTNGDVGISVQCGTYTVVGNYETGEGQIDLFIKKIPGSNAGGNILWMVADLGLSGAMFEPIAVQLSEALRGRYDIYLMDHRGTGRSVPSLHCPVRAGDTEESPTGDCIEFLEDTFGDTLEYYNSRFIARDYNVITSDITTENDVVLLYGSGYGAFVINQILIEEPEMADAVVLDSALFPSITSADTNAQDTGLDLVSRCTNFGSCREQIDRRDPEELIGDIFENFSDIDCVSQLGLSLSSVQRIFRNMAADVEYRALLLPVVVRMLRCNSEDLIYLSTGIDRFNRVYYEDETLRAQNSSFIQGQSYVLRNHIQITELLEVERGFQPSSAELLARSERLYFSNYLPTFVADLSRNWDWEAPNFLDPYDLAPSNVSMLILSGEFDMQASSVYSARIADHFDNELQRFLEIPFGGHITLYNSLSSNGVACGFTLIAEFFNQGRGNFNPFTVDESCIPQLIPIDFGAERPRTLELSAVTFGSDDPWGSGVIPTFFGGSFSLTSYVDFPFSTNNLPPIPNLSLSQIIVFDTYDSSRPHIYYGTLSFLSTGILPPSAWFSPDGAFVGASSSLFVSFISLCSCLFIAIIL